MLRQLAAAQGVSTSAALREMIRDTFARKKLSLKGKAAKKPSKKAPAKQTAKRAKKAVKKSARK